jgi:hypothetical protein
MAEEDPLADPVAVIVTLQQYQKKLSSQVELLRQDVATSKTFQAKYGVRPPRVCVPMPWGVAGTGAHGVPYAPTAQLQSPLLRAAGGAMHAGSWLFDT